MSPSPVCCQSTSFIWCEGLNPRRSVIASLLIGGANVLSEEFGEMHTGPVGELLELGSAREPVSQKHGVYVCSAHGRQ